ncbi:MAG: YoaK family protein [Acutalibacteraceae bacterium]|nr:YoaK family protein [Acutalibacteraceae bacterium]
MKSIKPFHGQMSDSFRAAVFIIMSGGFQDAYTFCCRGEVFANAQTGNIVLLSTALFRKDWQTVLKYLIPVISFLIGTAIAEFIHIKLKNYEKIHWRQIVLLFEIILLFTVGFLPDRTEALANALVSFVCALQVQAFHKVRGHAYASTMCIGNMRTGIESLCAYLRSGDKKILAKSMTYFGVILLFGIGAGFGSVITTVFGYKSIWICCALLFISFTMMFVTER